MATQLDAARYMQHLFGASDVRAMLVRAAVHAPPRAPLREWLHLKHQSPTLSDLSYLPSEGSLDSIVSHSNASLALPPTLSGVSIDGGYGGYTSSSSSSSSGGSTDDVVARAGGDAIDTDQLIYRLCCSLYKRAVQKTSEHAAASSSSSVNNTTTTTSTSLVVGGRFHHVATDPAHERNMSRMSAWMPLLHLFDPTRFYAYSSSGSHHHHHHHQQQQLQLHDHHTHTQPPQPPLALMQPPMTTQGSADEVRLPEVRVCADDVAMAPLTLDVRGSNNNDSSSTATNTTTTTTTATTTAATTMTTESKDDVAASASQLTARTPREASRKLLDELDVEKLSGGNSNHVYRLCHPHFPDKSILLRVYGGGSDEAIDRYRDTAAMRLMSASALSPAVLHSFRWGRVEEFMDDVATCTTDMLLASADLLAEVYETLYDVHRLPYDAFLPKTVNRERYKDADALAPLLREGGSPEHYCHANVARLTDALPRSPHVDAYYADDVHIKAMEDLCPAGFVRMSLRFLRLSSTLLAPAYRAQFVHFVCEQVAQLHALLQHHRVPLVFSHNDLTPGNILLSQRKVPARFRRPRRVDSDEDEVTPEVSTRSTPLSRKFVTKKGRVKNLVDLRGIVCIDFEYADVNYRCYDLGNTICELDYDYSRGSNSSDDGDDNDDDDGGPGFIKYLHTFPPAAYRARWGDLPMEYPRMPELIYDAWRAQQQQQPHEHDIATGDGDNDDDTATGDDDDASAHIGASCLRAIQAYFRGRRRVPLQPVTQHQLTEVFLGMLAAHLNWALWSLVLGCNPDACTNNTDSDDNFAKGSSGLDYVSYGNCRLREYLCLKHWLVAKGVLQP